MRLVTLAILGMVAAAIVLGGALAYLFLEDDHQPFPPGYDPETTLVIEVTRDRRCVIQEKLYADFGKPAAGDRHLQLLEDLFESRRQTRRAPPRDWVDHPTLVRAHPEARFEDLRTIWGIGYEHGGVWRAGLSLEGSGACVGFEIPRGPKEISAVSFAGFESPGGSKEVVDISVILCAGGDPEEHRLNLQRHASRPKDPTRCILAVEEVRAGEWSDRDVSVACRAALDQAMEEVVARLARGKSGKPRQILIDADPEVSAWSVFQVLKALGDLGVGKLDVKYP